jgi:hypothetical protein
MLATRNMRFVIVFLTLLCAIITNIASRLWRYPSGNAYLIIFISIPFALFLIPTALAKRQFAHFINIGFVILGTWLGISEYHRHGGGGPEIPTMYFAIPVMQSILVILSSIVAAIDLIMARHHNKSIASQAS